MGTPAAELDRLNVGDAIRFQFDDAGTVEADVVDTTSKGVAVELDRDVELPGTVARVIDSHAAWIEYHPEINEEHPVLIGRDGTSPDATVNGVEVVED